MVALSISGPPRYEAPGPALPTALARGDADWGGLRRPHRPHLPWNRALINSLIGVIDAATITAAIAAVEIFLLRTRWGRPPQQAPFLVTFGVKWLVYGVVIVVVNAGSLGQRVLGLALSAAPLDESLELLGLFFSFVAAFVVLLAFEIGQIVGPRNLRNIVSGAITDPEARTDSSSSSTSRARHP